MYNRISINNVKSLLLWLMKSDQDFTFTDLSFACCMTQSCYTHSIFADCRTLEKHIPSQKKLSRSGQRTDFNKVKI